MKTRPLLAFFALRIAGVLCLAGLGAAILPPLCVAADAGAAAVQKVTPGSAASGGAAANASENPQPKWSCAQQTVEAEPVWRGNQRVSFPFKITNEGRADLKIRARGG